MIMEIKFCCVTGHRKLPADKIEYVKRELRREILLAIEDGYTYFISGFAEGTDLYFASIVAEIKKENPDIYLAAAIPYRNRIKAKDELFIELLGQCNEIGCHSESYNPGVFMKRNRWMVQESERVIAVYDGRERGGTAGTLRYAYAMERDVRIIYIGSDQDNPYSDK